MKATVPATAVLSLVLVFLSACALGKGKSKEQKAMDNAKEVIMGIACNPDKFPLASRATNKNIDRIVRAADLPYIRKFYGKWTEKIAKKKIKELKKWHLEYKLAVCSDKCDHGKKIVKSWKL